MNDIRLIDANALKEELLKDKYISWDCEYAVTHEDIKRVIDNAPTVVPEDFMNPYEEGYERARKDFERPQGEWIKKVDDVGFISHICSECGAEIEVEDCSDDKFCFNCGADMRGKENEL